MNGQFKLQSFPDTMKSIFNEWPFIQLVYNTVATRFTTLHFLSSVAVLCRHPCQAEDGLV